MNALRKNTLVFVLINVTAVTIPIYLSGCGGFASPMTSAVNATNPTSGNSSNSGTSGVDNNNQNSGTSGTGTSGSGTSTSGSGTSTSGSGTSTSSSGTSTSSSGTSTSGSGTSTSGSGTSTSGSGTSTSSSGTSTSTNGAVAPAQALMVSDIQRLSNWNGVYDTGAGSSASTSTGLMSMIASPSLSGSARKFVTSYTNNGGERYWVSFGADTVSANFLYDTWIYLDDSSASIANLELDMNQVLSNGQTIIYGVQCDGWTGTWDYTVNNGTPAKPKGAWVHVKTAPCNPRKWTTNVWHHVQIAYSRDDAGNVTYKSVWLDGAEQDLNATVPSAFALGWKLGTLLTNFQVDGLGTTGTATVYVDNMTVYRW